MREVLNKCLKICSGSSRGGAAYEDHLLRKVRLSFSLSTDPEKEDSEGPLGGLMIGSHYALNLTSKSDRYWH